MGKFILDIPEELHNSLRHKSVDENINMSKLVLEGIKERLSSSYGKKKIVAPSGDSTINFELLFWSPVYYKDREERFKRKKFFNFYDGQIKLKDKGNTIFNSHFHSPAEMLQLIEEWYKKYVDEKLK